MADYKKAIEKVLKTEGGYVNDKNDKGGETYKGISRKNWPDWEGWEIIDREKKNKNFPKSLDSLVFLQDAVLKFYKVIFWDKVWGDKINLQSVAEKLFDSAVNEGWVPAIKRAEESVHLLLTGKMSNELLIKINSMV
jgi:lysozyme family protein